MAFTEFCCRSGGSNLNAGTRTGSSTEPGTAADLTYASGSWVASTGVFTVASGNPQTDGVAVGDFASVYADGSTVTSFVGRVTARDATTITVSLTAKAGTAPTDGTGNRTLKIGGAWAGPSGASGFPFGFMTAAPTNSAGNPIRVNFKSDQTYNMTSGITHSIAGPIVWQGYESSYGDTGRATIAGGSSGASYVLFTLGNVASNRFANLIFDGNGATGSAVMVSFSSSGSVNYTNVSRCVFKNSRGIGLAHGGQSSVIDECEFHLNAGAGLSTAVSAILTRCISHDNGGSGVVLYGQCLCKYCIIESNGGIGLEINATRFAEVTNCDFWNNGSHGIQVVGVYNAANINVENCNFLKNNGYGIDVDGSTNSVYGMGKIQNNAFGAGSQANSSGNISTLASDASEIGGSITYANDVTPWVNPANGDFRINLAAAKGAGRGTFTQTASSYSGTVGYPDIGAAQHQDSGGGGARIVNVRGGADQ